ncbi:uncharacterized protein BKA78DRAFT_291695 [Phyllosticta capitalensis]|uniref:uncharacterized protein n=1 Tax=Phyllosticta capitalensis TaxID=121624 RepID=UPI00312DA8BE
MAQVTKQVQKAVAYDHKIPQSTRTTTRLRHAAPSGLCAYPPLTHIPGTLDRCCVTTNLSHAVRRQIKRAEMNAAFALGHRQPISPISQFKQWAFTKNTSPPPCMLPRMPPESPSTRAAVAAGAGTIGIPHSAFWPTRATPSPVSAGAPCCLQNHQAEI